MLNRTNTNGITNRNLSVEQFEGRTLMAADLVMGAIESPIAAETTLAHEVSADEVLMPNFDSIATSEDAQEADYSSKRDLSEYIQGLLEEAMRYMQEREIDFWDTVEQNVSDPDGDGVDDNHGHHRSTSEQIQDRLAEAIRLMQEREAELWETIEQNIVDPDGDGVEDNHGLLRSRSTSEEIQGRLEEAIRYMQEREMEFWHTVEQNISDPDGDGVDDNHGFNRNNSFPGM